MGLRVALGITQGGRKIGTSLLVLRHMRNLKMADGKIYIKQNINNIVAAQGIYLTSAVLYTNVTKRTLYVGHVSVNTLLRRLQYFR